MGPKSPLGMGPPAFEGCFAARTLRLYDTLPQPGPHEGVCVGGPRTAVGRFTTDQVNEPRFGRYGAFGFGWCAWWCFQSYPSRNWCRDVHPSCALSTRTSNESARPVQNPSQASEAYRQLRSFKIAAYEATAPGVRRRGNNQRRNISAFVRVLMPPTPSASTMTSTGLNSAVSKIFWGTGP